MAECMGPTARVGLAGGGAQQHPWGHARFFLNSASRTAAVQLPERSLHGPDGRWAAHELLVLRSDLRFGRGREHHPGSHRQAGKGGCSALAARLQAVFQAKAPPL